MHHKSNSDLTRQFSDNSRNPRVASRRTQQQFTSRLRLDQIVRTEQDYSISEEPEYQDHPMSARNQLHQSFTQSRRGHNNLEHHLNWSAHEDLNEAFFTQGNQQELEEEPLQRQRRDSIVTQTNLAMCRPNQVLYQYVEYNSLGLVKGAISIDVQAWEKIESIKIGYEDSKPTPRNSCSWGVYGDCLYIFGGFTFNGRLDDLYSYNFSSSMWTKLDTKGHRPKPRENNGAQIYNGKMYVFGGYDGNSWLNDFYVLDLVTLVWEPVDQQGQKPSERFGFASGVHESSMVIFGGFDGNSQLNDFYTFEYEKSTWKKIELTGDLPAPRSCPSFACHHNHLYVFGGFDGINRLNDFYRINVATGKSSRISQHGTIPCPRYFHTSLIYNNKLILFGGYNGNVRLNDLYEFDLDKKLWTKLEVNEPPQGRSSMVLQVYNDTLYTFGGYNGYEVLNDFYRMPFRNAFVPKSTFQADIEKLINNPELADVIFVVEGREVYATRAILAVRSAHFKALLYDGFQESTNKHKNIILPNIYYSTFLDMLKYIYTDNVDLTLPINRLINLMMLADQYMIERLQFLCEERVSKMLTLNNVIDLLLLSTKFSSILIKNSCMKILEENISTLKKKQEFQKLMQEPEILMAIIQRKC